MVSKVKQLETRSLIGKRHVLVGYISRSQFQGNEGGQRCAAFGDGGALQSSSDSDCNSNMLVSKPLE